MSLPSRPYLIRAMYEWINDNRLTPYLMVNAKLPGVQVPEEYVEDGRIILNISPDACRGLHLENDRIVFSAQFGGAPKQIFVPPAAVLAIYAKENGKGMMFNDNEYENAAGTSSDSVTSVTTGTNSTTESPTRSGKKPTLKVVK